jgi:small-conductance mechanosensitive channel/FtsZ-binding cell division protein ZapB
MGFLESIPSLLRAWIPVLATLLIGIGVVAGVRHLMGRREPAVAGERVRQQSLIALLVGVLVVAVVLELPIAEAARGQLLSLLGILLTAAIALSSTTVLGNAMAGLMLRSIRNFRPGDFIVVDGHRGRVSDLGLLRTEIQTERRNLTTLPNLYLVTKPVTVVRSSGTFISATVSIGYDEPRERVAECLKRAAGGAGLTDPFVFVLELGDFSIVYQAAGYLEEVKYLLSAESALRECMLDALHTAGIEIVSPTFMNQRRLDPGDAVIPRVPPGSATARRAARGEARPEERIFDKADQAESVADAVDEFHALEEEIESLKRGRSDLGEEERRGADARIEALERRQRALEAQMAVDVEKEGGEAPGPVTPGRQDAALGGTHDGGTTT